MNIPRRRHGTGQGGVWTEPCLSGRNEKSAPEQWAGSGWGKQEVDLRPDCRRPRGLSEGVRALGCGNREAVRRSQAEAGAVRAVCVLRLPRLSLEGGQAGHGRHGAKDEAVPICL